MRTTIRIHAFISGHPKGRLRGLAARGLGSRLIMRITGDMIWLIRA